MNTALKTEAEKKEYFDSPEVLDQKVQKLANLILQSERFWAFTGAGLSTAAGIPDYRSGANTVIETGPGCWEKMANIAKARKNGTLKNEPIAKNRFNTTIQKAFPTKAHMALNALQECGLLKGIISQNIDGLHRKSGFPADKLYELHGNTNLEFCAKCDKAYMRDFRCRRNGNKNFDHVTGRKCDNPKCYGDLYDSVINFGENLRDDVYNPAEQYGTSADVMLSLGSSLRVTPACDIPFDMTQNGGKLVIVNLQKTPLDKHAELVIHGRIQNVMGILMEKLNIAIPEFKIQRYMRINFKETKFGGNMHVEGIDSNNDPYQIFAKKQATYNQNSETQIVNLTFQGHYNENQLAVEVPNDMLTEKNFRIKMSCNPFIYDKSGTRIGLWEEVEAQIGDKVFPLTFKSIGTAQLSLNKNDIAPTKRSNSLARQSSFGSATTKSSNSKLSRGKSQSRWR